MTVRINIPTALRPFVGRREAVEYEARTVGEALERLTSDYAELQRHLFADNGSLRSFVNVFVNDQDIRYLQKEKTPLREGDTISIIPSIAGGRRIV